MVPAELPGFRSDVRVTRPELEQLISGPLAGVLDAIDDTLQRNEIPVRQRLGGRHRRRRRCHSAGDAAAVRATARTRRHHPAVPAQRRRRRGAGCRAEPRARTRRPGWLRPPDAPTGMAPCRRPADGGAAGLARRLQSAGDGASSATCGALAWSQDDARPEIRCPTPATTTQRRPPTPTRARPPPGHRSRSPPARTTYQDELAPLPWYKRPPLLFGAGGCGGTSGGRRPRRHVDQLRWANRAPVTETASTDSDGDVTARAATAGHHGHRRPRRRGDHHREPAATSPAAVHHDNDGVHDVTHHDDDHHHHARRPPPLRRPTTTTTRTTTTTPPTTSPPPTTTTPPPTTTTAPPRPSIRRIRSRRR